jgi:dienelactone hydrolase
MISALAVLLCASPAAPAHQGPPPQAQLVSFPAPGGVTLQGFLYLPDGPGPFPAVLWNHGSEKFPAWQPELAAFYNAHGYAFFIPHRRGHGRSQDAGPYIMDEQRRVRESATDRADGERKLIALHEQAGRDVSAALTWLKAQPKIDAQHIMMSGVSFGGIQTLLAAERGEGVRAFAVFAPGAMMWSDVTAIHERLSRAAAEAKAPVLLLQAKNDYDLGPSNTLGPVLEQRGHGRAHIFPAFGDGHQEGHGGFACRADGIAVWGDEVLAWFRAAR